MIHKLTIRGPNAFRRDIPFHMGLNLVYGKRSESSTAQGTCNSIGKSCVLWAIDFCLGAKLNMEEDSGKTTLPGRVLGGWEFDLDLDLGDARIKVTRTVDLPEMVFVEGDVALLPFQPTVTPTTGAENTLTRRPFYDIASWQRLLGVVLFDFSQQNAAEVSDGATLPTFRELFAYFCRKGFGDVHQPGGFLVQRAKKSKTLSYLFGFDWQCVGRHLKLTKDSADKKKINEACRVKAEEWGLSIEALQGECRRKRALLEAKKSEIRSFALDPDYRDKEMEANALTREIAELRSRLVTNRRTLASAEGDSAMPSVPVDAVRRMYEAVGVELGRDLWRTLEETAEFHRQIDTNRQQILDEQKRRLRSQIASDEEKARAKDTRRAELLRHLSSYGALDEYNRLQSELTELSNDLAVKEGCHDDYTTSKSVLDVAKERKKEIEELAESGFRHSTDLVFAAQRAYCGVTEALYGQGKGGLTIDVRSVNDVLGYDFKPTLAGSNAPGVGKMKILAFDLAILLRQLEQARKIDFMLHDGQIFSDTDSRQIAAALKFIHGYARDHGVQYITGMNYCDYPEEWLRDSFSLEDVKVLELSDESEETMLFGFRFDQPTVRPQSVEPEG